MLPSQDSATGRALKTGLQAIVGFIIGLVIAIWQVPGVPEVIVKYSQDNFGQVFLTIGLPVAVTSGVISFIWNFLRKDVKNYN